MMARDKKRKVDEDAGSDDGEDTVDVTFDFFDLDPIDYHALKHLLSQLFSLRSTSSGSDAAGASTAPPSKAPLKPVPDDIDVGELADVVLGPQKEWVGGTVKCDGQESDPYGFVSVLDLNAYPDKPSISALRAHLLRILDAPSTAPPEAAVAIRTRLKSLLEPGGSGLGVLLSERLVNMPVQIMPHMLRQVGNEISHAQKKGAPGFGFSHLLIPSRVFYASATPDDDEEMADATAPPDHSRSKKQRKANSVGNGKPELASELCLFHPEDEVISRFALQTVHFELEAPRSGADADTVGVEQKGRLMLIDSAKWDAMVNALEGYLGGSAGFVMQLD